MDTFHHRPLHVREAVLSFFMMAIQLSQSSQSVRLCMPLAKFSYASVHSGSIGPIPWIHLTSRNDLFVLIDPFEAIVARGPPEKRYRFKVLQDPNAHEDLDLSLLAREARRAIEESRVTLMSGQQPPFTIIVKAPCVAMRYPIQGEQVRRFQVRFLKEEDFYETLKVFTMMKVPFVEAGSMHGQHSNAVPQIPTTLLNKTTSYSVTPSGLNRPTVPPVPSFHSAATDTSMPHSTFPRSNNNSRFVAPAAGQVSLNDPLVHPKKSTTTWTDERLFTLTPHFPDVYSVTSASASENGLSSSMPDAATHQVSTYIPRPSTAPVTSLDSSKSILPPKRDLPFQRKVGQNILPATAKPTEPIYTNVCVDESSANLDNAGDDAEQQDPEAGQCINARRTRRTTAQAKNLQAGNKPKACTSRKKGKAGKAGKSQATHVPSVEELLQRKTSHLDTAILVGSQIDTQALLEKADAIQAARRAGKEVDRLQPTVTAGSHSDNIAVSSAKLHELDTAEQLSNRNIVLQQQAISGSVSDVATRNGGNGEPSKERGLQSEALIYQGPNMKVSNTVNQESHDQPDQPDHPSTIGCTNQNFPTEIQPRPHNSSNIPTALSLLLSDPNFAQSALNLPFHKSRSTTTTAAEFGSLSSHDRHVAYESFVIQNLEDDNFLSLCKTLEGVWQRIFVKI